MNKYSIALLFGAFSCALNAQTPGPVTLAADLKNQYNQVKDLITKAADKMSDDGYAFQPTAPERNFGGWVAHVADSEARICGAVSGTTKNVDAGSKTSKADLVAALKSAFDSCDPVYAALTDANVNDQVSMGRGGPRTKAGVLAADIAHDNECYGTMAVYLRLKELVPPSSEGRGGRGRGPAAPGKKE
jgi:hypothetical protein